MWRDNWIPRPFSYKPISPQGRCRIRYVSDLLNDNGSWNYELLIEYFVQADVTEILKIRASPRLQEDVLAWGPGELDIFTVKSAYTLAFEEAHRATDVSSSRHRQVRGSVGTLFGKAGRRYPAEYLCGWQYNIESGPWIEDSDMACKRKPHRAIFVTRRRIRWITCSCNVCSQGTSGIFALPKLGWSRQTCPRSSLDWKSGGRQVGRRSSKPTEEDLTPSSC